MDVNSAQSSQALSELGTYDPVHSKVNVDEESIVRWLNAGAQMSETVRDLFRSRGILARWRGFEGVLREGALTKDKPKRRRKLAAAAAAPAEEEALPADKAQVEEAPAMAEEAKSADSTAAEESVDE